MTIRPDQPAGASDPESNKEGEPVRLDRLPLFPLSAPLFPGMALPLHIFEPRYRQLLSDRANDEPMFGVVLTLSGREVGERPEIHQVGTSADLMGIHQHEDGRADIAIRGARRFRVVETDWSGPYAVASVEWLPEDDSSPDDLSALADRVRTAMLRLVAVAANAGGMPVPDLHLPENAVDLGYLLSRTLWLNTWERQQLLELPKARERLDRLATIIRREHRLLTQAGASGTPIEHPGSRFSPN